MTPPRRWSASLVAACCLGAGISWSQDSRPSEEEMFGAPPAETKPAPPPPAPVETGTDLAKPPQGSTADPFDFGAVKDAFAEDESLDDPLRIGGMFYQRFLASALEHTPFERSTFSVPMLLDGYFDARPNDRLRGFVLARMRYDPTIDSTQANVFGALPAPNPTIVLDQFWMRFDIARTVFVTAGKQHVKWGASRFWNPTDYLHPVFRNALAPFDDRLGTNMVKLHVPWEAKGWNFYALGLWDNPSPANLLGKVGGAVRGEIVLGQTEIGIGGMFSQVQKPRLAIDFSSGLGPFDVYGELAMRSAKGLSRYQRTLTPASFDIDALFVPVPIPTQYAVQTSGGVTWTVPYTDNDTVTFGLEYFYNSLGYDSIEPYPYLLYKGRFQPFYLGQHYGAFYILLNAPGNWDKTNFTLSTLGNFSDMSFTTRLDVFIRVLSRLQVELFAAAHYGYRGGEFRFALDIPSFPAPTAANPAARTPEIHTQPSIIDLGAGFRFAL